MRAGLMPAYPFPITGAKIHPPLLRADTLTRPRLNDWMEEAVRGRVVLVVAEAGYGKTTFLGDWAAHSGRRTAWYRLEPDDADWLVFLRHLVAAGREIDPEFGLETMELLLALGTGAATQADAVASLLREYADFAATIPEGLTLIFDDYHAIERSAPTAAILKGLIERTGPTFSIVIASRSAPRLALGRIRSHGGVRRLDGTDLCFVVEEAERLFRDAYRKPLEPDVLGQLVARTEGWAALLTLVRTSLEEKNAPEARALVAQLNSTTGDLYDFLAEEVLGTLSPAMRRFLERASVLVWVDVEGGVLVDELSGDEVDALITEAETLGLLGRPDRDAPLRFHPLVRDFLRARLADEIGEPAVLALHRRVAVALEPTDWLGAAWHYRAAGDPADAARVIDAAVPAILASGTIELAAQFLDGSAGDPDRPGALILASRLELERTGVAAAISLAEAANGGAANTPLAGTALLNLAAVDGIVGYSEDGVRYARQALSGGLAAGERIIAEAIVAMSGVALELDLRTTETLLRRLAQSHRTQGSHRYAGITLLNLAGILEWLGDPGQAAEVADEGERELIAAGVRGAELAAVLAARAASRAQLGDFATAERLLAEARGLSSPLAQVEARIESARIHAALGSRVVARTSLDELDLASIAGGYIGTHALARGEVALRERDYAAARDASEVLATYPCRDVAGRSRAYLLGARLAIRINSTDGARLAAEAERVATAQGSAPARWISGMLAAIGAGGPLHDVVTRIPERQRYCLSVLAEEIAENAQRLSESALAVVEAEARGRPDRWREALVWAVLQGAEAATRCAAILVSIGSPAEAATLRGLAAKRPALKPYALALTKRLAPTVEVSDLGPVHVALGEVSVRIVRRRVLALLCYLSSRPQFAATRDEILEALWPDLGIDTAGNSLHQTIYFLRRVFEPDFREGLSAGYIEYDGDVVRLDSALFRTASRRAWELAYDRTDPHAVEELLNLYTGRYAMDFAYEDWSTDYRDHLHAAVLGRAEEAISAAAHAGRYEEAIAIAHRMLALDPEADGIELALLRAYKRGGRHAAAAEQYAHYAAFIRNELGAEPPRLEDV